MTGAAIILITLIIIGIILRHFDKTRSHGDDSPSITPTPQDTDDAQDTADDDDTECCGQHIICKKTSLSPAFPDDAQYFDDHELDRFRDKAPDQYTDEEIEEFRDILLTMRPDEVPAWTRALQTRRIPIPIPIREEIIMIVQDLK